MMSTQKKSRFFSKYLVLFSCVQVALFQSMVISQENEKLKAELQIDDLELVDWCESYAHADKIASLHTDFHNKTEAERRYGSLIKEHYNLLRLEVDVPAELEINWTYQVKPGDALLDEEKWYKYIEYKLHIEELQSQSKIMSSISGVDQLLGKLVSERNEESLKNLWSSWQFIYNETDRSDLIEHVGLVKDAAELNEYESVEEYWEKMVNFDTAYSQAESIWIEISPFYKRLHSFVRTRLFKYYNLDNNTENIPVYLLGDKLGTDWSNIADIILPHPQLHYDADMNLKFKNVESIFEDAEKIGQLMGLEPLGDKFWRKSNFNSPGCLSSMFVFCEQGYTEIRECNETGWTVYLDAHETTLKIAMNNMDYVSLPRQNLRFCAIDDAVEKLGSIIAVETLEKHGIVDPIHPKITDEAELNEFGTRDDPAEMTKLLLTALRVVPSLPYYLMVDKWRLEFINDNSTNVADSWWSYRKQYTGIQGVTNDEPEYLQDERILSNQPCINKFFGTLMAFQMFRYHKDRNNDNFLGDFKENDMLVDTIRNRHTDMELPYYFSSKYGVEVGAQEMLEYFEPLENYFERAPLEQVPVATTTTTTTSTTTTSTTTPATTITSTTITSTTTTSTTTTSTTGKPTSEEHSRLTTLNNNAEIIVNDQPNIIGENISNSDDHLAMYLGVGFTILLGCMLLGTFGYKKIRRKRRTNNRRFDT